MPSISAKELEEELSEAGNKLLEMPSSAAELLPLLDRIEVFLTKVEQSPPESMQNAISPLVKALAVDELLAHPDVDVRVGVAACISEITRITAPEAPYDDEKMKDVFQLIVSSFEDLSDTSSRSYEKRSMILETVAKVRSCVIMLDLECDQLIMEMFQHLLKAVREYHSVTVFTSMATIMSLVLTDSEEISPDLLSPLLACLKRNNEEVLPVAKNLCERVFQMSADKLRPYLSQAVKSLEICLDDYSEVVATVCQGTSSNFGRNNEIASTDKLVTERKSDSASLDQAPPSQLGKDVAEATSPGEEDPAVTKSPKSITSNGINEAGNGEQSDAVQKVDSDESSGAKPLSETKADGSAAQKSLESESNSEQPPMDEGRKQDSPNNSTESSDLVDGEKEADQVPDQATEVKDIHTAPDEVRSVEAAKSLDRVEETGDQLSPAKVSESKTTSAPSPTQSASLPEVNRSKRTGRAKKKEIVSKEASESKTASGPSPTQSEDLPEVSRSEKVGHMKKKETVTKEASESKTASAPSPTQSQDLPEVSRSEKVGRMKKKEAVTNEEIVADDATPKKASEGTSSSEMKKQKHVDKTEPSESSDNKVSSEEVSSDNDKTASDSEASSQNQLDKQEKNNEKRKDMSSSKTVEGKKQGAAKPRLEKNTVKSSKKENDKKGMVKSPRSSMKSTQNEDDLDETPKNSAKRKRTPGTDKASGSREYGENLVGSRVKVWWPKDRKFYKGVIDSFDPVKNKHKVLYIDGDEEILNLKKERWELIGDDMDVEHATPNPSSEVRKNKKAKADSEMSNKQPMTVTPKSNKKESASRSGGKSKDGGRNDPKAKDNTSKSSGKFREDTTKSKELTHKVGGKSVDDSAKDSSKSKDLDVAKPSSHSKQDTQKSGKIKVKTPQGGSTLDSARNTKSSSSKGKGTGNVKEKLTDSAKTSESIKMKSPETTKSQSEAKSSKKRRR